MGLASDIIREQKYYQSQYNRIRLERVEQNETLRLERQERENKAKQTALIKKELIKVYFAIRFDTATTQQVDYIYHNSGLWVELLFNELLSFNGIALDEYSNERSENDLSKCGFLKLFKENRRSYMPSKEPSLVDFYDLITEESYQNFIKNLRKNKSKYVGEILELQASVYCFFNLGVSDHNSRGREPYIIVTPLNKAYIQNLLSLIDGIRKWAKLKLDVPTSRFLSALEKFNNSLSDEPLTNNQLSTLYTICHDKKHNSSQTFNFSPLLKQKLLNGIYQEEENDQKKYQNINHRLIYDEKKISEKKDTGTLPFIHCIDRYIHRECLPYFQVMEPETINHMIAHQDFSPVVSFIVEHHKDEACLSDAIYAPDGKIEASNVKNLIYSMKELPSILNLIRPHIPFVLNAGEIASGSSIEKDKNNWPKITLELFKQIISCNALILYSIKEYQGFRPTPVLNNLEDLLPILKNIDSGQETEFEVEPRVLESIEKRYPSSLSLGFRILFISISSTITNLMISRVQEQRGKDLNREYSDLSNNIGLKTNAFNNEVFETVFTIIQTYIERFLLPYVQGLSFNDFMNHIEISGEGKIDYINPHAMGIKTKEEGIRLDDLLFHDSLPIQEAVHYSRVEYFLKKSFSRSNTPRSLQVLYYPPDAATVWCLKTVNKIIEKPYHTLNEILLLICAIKDECYRDINYRRLVNIEEQPLDEQPLSEEKVDVICKKVPALLDGFIKNRAIQYAYYQSANKLDSHYKETDKLFNKIIELIESDPLLLKEYCKYHLKKDAVEESQLSFCVRNFSKVKKELEEYPTLLKKLIEACIPIWKKNLQTLRETLWKHQKNTCFSHFSSASKVKQKSLKLLPPTLINENTKWQVLGNGAFNIACKSEDEKLVFKYLHLMFEPDIEKQKLDSYDRAVRLWNEINADLLPKARLAKVYIDGYLVSGWTCLYVKGRQATDEEMKKKVIDIFNRTGRIVIDATSYENFITTDDGKVILVDVGWALNLELDRLSGKALSEASQEGWKNFDLAIFREHYQAYPQTIDTLKALIFIKKQFPNVKDVSFIMSLEEDKLSCLCQAFDDLMLNSNSSMISEAISLLTFQTIKNTCITKINSLIVKEDSVFSSVTLFSKTKALVNKTNRQIHELTNEIKASNSFSELYLPIKEIIEVFENCKISEKIKIGLVSCTALIANQEPGIIDFELSNRFLR